jgi:hypothetical protein
MIYCIYVLCMKRESSHFLGLFARNFCSQGAFMFSAFAALSFGICFVETCKLEERNFVFIYA